MREPPTINRTSIHHPETTRPDSAEVRRQLDAAIAQVRVSTAPVIEAKPSTTLEGPYLDYSRTLTAEGGILLTYKDIEDNPIYLIGQILLWSATTYGEYRFLFHAALAHEPWMNVAAILFLAVVNFLIAISTVERYRTLEIRPDCMILDGEDLFWAASMEKDGPQFQQDEEGNFKLVGIYGTRFVEFLTVRHFDEHDRMPEVFAAHFLDATQQLWPPRR